MSQMVEPHCPSCKEKKMYFPGDAPELCQDCGALLNYPDKE